MPGRLACRVCLLLVIALQPARSGLWPGIGALLSDKIEYTIAVTNSQGRPIDGATIWLLGDDESRQDLKADDLERLVRRYSADADFVFANSLQFGLIVLRTDQAGVARVTFDESDIGELPSLSNHFAAIKRGYEPVLRSDVAKVDSRRKLTFVLKTSAIAKTEPLLEELDHLRALAERQVEQGAKEQTASALTQIGSRLRAIASALEAKGDADGAAAAYYNLAYLPSVEMAKDEGGNSVVRGYSRGFDERSPHRIADRARAWELNQSHPWLDFQRMRARLAAQGLMTFLGNKNSEVRRSFIDQTELFIREHGERMWPDVFTQLWRAYNAEGDFTAGCSALQRFHTFAPSQFDSQGWWNLLGMYIADVELHGGVAAGCTLTGGKGD